jgi:hypothetical protein
MRMDGKESEKIKKRNMMTFVLFYELLTLRAFKIERNSVSGLINAQANKAHFISCNK